MASILENFIKKTPNLPGVYQMFDENRQALYIGKAKDLKKRLSQYQNPAKLTPRIARMVSLIQEIEIITVGSEAEALLLEASLIKNLMPRYNILLRDDKSYPFILITENHKFSRITKHRGKQKIKGKYFGPFTSVGDVNRVIDILKKSFLIRSCLDSDFNSRTRPCMEYQIKRCTAPCVGKVTLFEYKKQVSDVMRFLSGKNLEVQEEFVELMEQASKQLDYEKAADYRDRIKSLSHIRSKQNVILKENYDADFIAIHEEMGEFGIAVFFFRSGQNYGSEIFYPRYSVDDKKSEILTSFIGQFYQKHTPPNNVDINGEIENKALLSEALSIIGNKKVAVNVPKQGEKFEVLKLAEKNLKRALAEKINEKKSKIKIHKKLVDIFTLTKIPKRIEVYDNSHIAGKYRVGGMVVANLEGFDKNSYRRYSIKRTQFKQEDDYAMMAEVLSRRFANLIKNKVTQNDENWPDLLLIDGGKGHLNVVLKEAQKAGLKDKLNIIAIAKGVDRNSGREDFYQEKKAPFKLPKNDPVLFYLQNLRDEAHRFAISSHKIKRAKSMQKSILEEIEGIGATRKKALLNYFGSVAEIKKASLGSLMQAPGINKKVAEIIYDFFH